jgi:NAD(P)-dependent dehydrogenase (short-subunit alcohol dehydrogenase family)
MSFLQLSPRQVAPLTRSFANAASSCRCEGFAGIASGVFCPLDGRKFNSTFETFNKGARRSAACMILRPTSEAALQNQLTQLAQHRKGLTISVKNGGHNPAAWYRGGDVIVDLANLSGIEVNDAAETVKVAGGERWGSVYKRLEEKGLLVHGAGDYDVGVAGISLVGGVTFLSGLHGRVSEGVVGARLVLLNGTVLELQPGSPNGQLLELLQKSGGITAFPLGIISSLTFRTHKEGDKIPRIEASRTFKDANEFLNAANQVWNARTHIDDPNFGFAVLLSSRPLAKQFQLKVLLMHSGAHDARDHVFASMRNELVGIGGLEGLNETKFTNYADFVKSETYEGKPVSIVRWRGDFVHYSDVAGSLAALLQVDGKHLMGDSGEDGRVDSVELNIEDWGLKHSGNKQRLVLIGHILMNDGANYATDRSSASYDQGVLPRSRGTYLGYGTAPSREDVFHSIEHWRPGAVAALRCWRRTLGAQALVSGVAGSANDVMLEQQAIHRARSLLQSPVSEFCLPESYPHGPSAACSREDISAPLGGKKALVVGGTGVIGEEVVQQLSELGAAVVIAGRNRERCKQLAEQVWGSGGLATCEEVDLNQNASVRRLANKAFVEDPRPPDILVLSAAASKPSSLWTNHLSSVLLAKNAFEQNPETIIVAVSSGLTQVATPAQVSSFLQGGLDNDPFLEHAASKRAQAAALLQLHRQGARVTLVMPTVTVKSTLVDSQLPFAPPGLKKGLHFGTAVEASRPVVDAVLRSSRAAASVASAKAKVLNRQKQQQQQAFLEKQDDSAVLPCRSGCSEAECVGSETEYAQTWSASLLML